MIAPHTLQAFRGIWRMQPTSPTTTRLSYALHVQPQVPMLRVAHINFLFGFQMELGIGVAAY